MTKFELYTKIRDFFNGSLQIVDQQEENDFFAEAIELCEKEAAALENAAKRNAEKRAAKNAENAPLYEQILEFVGADARTASEVAAVLNVNVQKASSLLRQLVAEGKLTVTDVKVPKKGTQKAYAAFSEE